jgi:hypothetical protein
MQDIGSQAPEPDENVSCCRRPQIDSAMAAPDDLIPFVREALLAGRSRADIAATLRQAGWTDEQTAAALGAFADIDYPVPVPRPKPYLSAKEAFWYLVLFTTLYLSAVYLGTLLFQLINLAFPDATDSGYAIVRSDSLIRWAISVLVVAFPLFLYMSRLVGKAVARDPAKRASKVRKWLTYLTLFVAVCVLVGDAVSLLYNFLDGDLTARFVLKSLVVAVIAGGILGYYLADLRRDEQEEPDSPTLS